MNLMELQLATSANSSCHWEVIMTKELGLGSWAEGNSRFGKEGVHGDLVPSILVFDKLEIVTICGLQCPQSNYLLPSQWWVCT